MRRLRFGVVGCGAISTDLQLPALRRSDRVDLVAVTDLDAGHARAVAGRFGVPESYGDHRALVGRVDAALVATPNTTHADIAVDLLEAGVHVLCEKPMATTRGDVERMLAAAERSAARLMAAHCLRFSPNIDLLHRIVADGWLGGLGVVEAGIGGSYEDSARRTDFRRQRRLSGGGVLVDLGVHVVDLAIWIAGGAPTEVAYDATAASGWEVETDAEVALAFADGTRARLGASFSRGLENQIVARGPDGWASASLYLPTELLVFADRARVCRRAGMQRILLPDVSMYDRQIAHFCEAVLGAHDFGVRADEVRATIDVIERCYGEG
jgi:predicted dehydrogenase